MPHIYRRLVRVRCWDEQRNLVSAQIQVDVAFELDDIAHYLGTKALRNKSRIHEGHWAVGWVEWIAIHQDDEKSLAIADEIAEQLEDYPVVDEGDFSELETEDANETWTQCFNPAERIKYVKRYRSQFDFHDYADLIGCIRGKYFAGYASELLS